MYSLVVLCCENYGIGDHEHCVVSGFDTEDAAYEYAARKLVEARKVKRHKVNHKFVGYKLVGDPEVYETEEGVVQAWSEWLGASEYFHVVPESHCAVST